MTQLLLFFFQKSDLFDLVTEAVICHPESSHTATQIIYILSIYGADINSFSQVSLFEGQYLSLFEGQYKSLFEGQ